METRKISGHVATVMVFTAIALVVLFVLFRWAGGMAFGEQYEVRAVVPSAGNLTQGTTVTMAGARIGTVTGVTRRGVGALVDIRIDEGSVKPLARDATAQLAVRTPLGENYIQLFPGDSREDLENGGLVNPRPGNEYVDVDEILSVLQGKTRERARAAVQGLGAAVDGRGEELNTTLSRTASILEAGSGLTARIADDKERIAQLVRQLGDVSAAIGERRESVKTLARQGVTTFTALAERDEAVRSLIDELPGTLRQVRGTTRLLDATSRTATPVVANLGTALREVRPAVRRLAPAAAEGRKVVSELSDAAPPLENTLAAVRKASPAVSAMLPELDRVFCQANPMLRYLKPYIGDITSFATSLGAAANSYDAIGHTIRLMPVINETALLGAPPEVNKAAATLLRVGVFEKATALGFRPYPEPGQAETAVKPGESRITGPADLAKTGFKYTRVTPDC